MLETRIITISGKHYSRNISQCNKSRKKIPQKMTQLNVLIDYDCLPEKSKIIE